VAAAGCDEKAAFARHTLDHEIRCWQRLGFAGGEAESWTRPGREGRWAHRPPT
jgi:hypothetical protein